MTVRTPKFIISECERLKEALPPKHKKCADEVLERLSNLNNVEDAMQLLDYMAELEEAYVYPCMTPPLFKRSLISESLTTALEKYENKEEATEMMAAIQRMARFETSWCQDDESYKWDRTFNVVVSRTEWRRVCARAKVLPTNGSIKIALQIKSPKKLKTAERAQQKISRKTNMMENDVEFYYEIWFRQKTRAIYHIYLP